MNSATSWISSTPPGDIIHDDIPSRPDMPSIEHCPSSQPYFLLEILRSGIHQQLYQTRVILLHVLLRWVGLRHDFSRMFSFAIDTSPEPRKMLPWRSLHRVRSISAHDHDLGYPAEKGGISFPCLSRRNLQVGKGHGPSHVCIIPIGIP